MKVLSTDLEASNMCVVREFWIGMLDLPLQLTSFNVEHTSFSARCRLVHNAKLSTAFGRSIYYI